MPIKFTVIQDEGYYISKYTGMITDAELMTAYKEFLRSDAWIPGYGELLDLGDADVSSISVHGLRKLADMIGPIVQQNNITPVAVVYAPHDLPYGLARYYAMLAEQFESFLVFRDYAEAESNLKQAIEISD